MPIERELQDLTKLLPFIRESNEIEGITDEPSERQLEAIFSFLALPQLTVADVENLVNVLTDGAPLRRNAGQDVTVGGRPCPPGGTYIVADLMSLLETINRGKANPFESHVLYEFLHPFMDGNGRSGRLIWLWQVGLKGLNRPFLKAFYYQTLDSAARAMIEQEEVDGR